MNDECTIYIDRLQIGQSVAICEEVEPSFMEIEEEELIFDQIIQIKGEATLVDKEIALRLSVQTSCKIICSICNTLFDYTIMIDPFFFAQPTLEIPDHIFDFHEPLREAILLEIPYVAECHSGKCPARKNIASFLTSQDTLKKREEEWHPFKDLSENGEK